MPVGYVCHLSLVSGEWGSIEQFPTGDQLCQQVHFTPAVRNAQWAGTSVGTPGLLQGAPSPSSTRGRLHPAPPGSVPSNGSTRGRGPVHYGRHGISQQCIFTHWLILYFIYIFFLYYKFWQQPSNYSWPIFAISSTLVIWEIESETLKMCSCMI